jgi:lipopolysaccharide transport system ATP-binding protein
MTDETPENAGIQAVAQDEVVVRKSSEPDIADLVVVADGVGKCYQMYSRPQHRLWQTLTGWRGKIYYEEFWALRGVSFRVRRGEAVGILGRNGSGKSTLLQILAGTVPPSEGQASTTGRVSALLELGSGFNPEFTGRENVHLNGTILGLSTQEVAERFDEIAAFADIGPFIEQPIKTYSSGMVVRLAFAVQALLDPDVLIVDEALAVGDEAFQRKCFAFLERFQARGGTILFVTHSTQTVVKLCNRALLLDGGRLLAHGPSKLVVDIYQKMLYGTPRQCERLRSHLQDINGAAEDLVVPSDEPVESAQEPVAQAVRPPADARVRYEPNLPKPQELVYGTGEAEIIDLMTCAPGGAPANIFPSGELGELRYRVRFHIAAEDIRFGMMIKTVEGVDVAGVSSLHLGQRLASVEAGQAVEVSFRLALNLAPGMYFLNSGVSAVKAGEEAYLHRRVDALSIRIDPPDSRDIYGLVFTDPRLSIRVVQARSLSHV